MVDKRKWWKNIWIVPITILIYWTDLLPNNVQETVSAVLLDKFGGRISPGVDNADNIFLLDIQQLYFLIVFNLIFANQIVDHFRYSCIYVFSRIKNRKKWFLRCSLELWVIASLYSFLYVGTLFFIGSLSAKFYITTNDLWIAFVLWFKVNVICYITTLLLNIISIRLGSVLAFIIIFGGIALNTYISPHLMNTAIICKHPTLAIFDPIHGIYEGMLINGHNVSLFIGYNTLLLILVTIFGIYFVNKMDIALIHMETK